MDYLSFLFGLVVTAVWILAWALFFVGETENENTEVQKEEND